MLVASVPAVEAKRPQVIDLLTGGGQRSWAFTGGRQSSRERELSRTVRPAGDQKGQNRDLAGGPVNGNSQWGTRGGWGGPKWAKKGRI